MLGCHLVMTLGSILSIFVAFNIDDEYQSTALLKYSEDDLGQSFNTNSALSGLSSIAGINQMQAHRSNRLFYRKN